MDEAFRQYPHWQTSTHQEQDVRKAIYKALLEMRERPMSTASVASARIMVSAEASKIAPRSESEKMPTGKVTQPGG